MIFERYKANTQDIISFKNTGAYIITAVHKGFLVTKEKYKIPDKYINAIPPKLIHNFNQYGLNFFEKEQKNTKIGNANIKPPAGPVIWCNPPHKPEKTGAPTAPNKM